MYSILGRYYMQCRIAKVHISTISLLIHIQRKRTSRKINLQQPETNSNKDEAHLSRLFIVVYLYHQTNE